MQKERLRCREEKGTTLKGLLVNEPAIISRGKVQPANQDFPSPGWKIAIGSLTTSALAALAKCPPTTPIGYRQYTTFFSSVAVFIED